MATPLPTPAPRVVALSGDQITVQVRSIPGNPTEIIWHVTRNGTREERFTLDEFSKVLNVSTALLAQARSRNLSQPPTEAKP